MKLNFQDVALVVILRKQRNEYYKDHDIYHSF